LWTGTGVIILPEKENPLTPLLEKILSLAVQAGEAILEISAGGFQIRHKEDSSPVTIADLTANGIITGGLVVAYPEIPILSEEGEILPYSDRRKWKTYFLVDPLDGTREFIRQNGEYTVNIALMEDGLPVAGVVYAPVTGLVWVAQRGQGSYGGKWEKGSLTDVHQIEVSSPPQSGEAWQIGGSRSHRSREYESYIRRFVPRQETIRGSSLKICGVADGSLHIHPRVGPTSEWDTAAAHAVLLEAGGDIVDLITKAPLRYNRKESLINPSYLAAGGNTLSLLAKRDAVEY